MSFDEDGLLPYPRFSIEERDRRWRAVRALMSEQGIDAIVCPANTGHSTDFQANSRYLSHCGGGGDADIAVVFPLDGDVTVVATSAVERWSTVQNWVTDIREARRRYGKVVADRLSELSPKRIGVAGLGGGTRTPEGTIGYHAYVAIAEGLPGVEIVDATDILAEVREVKSAEEIEALRRSMEMVDAAYDAEYAAAQVGAIDQNVWAETIATMVRAGSELPVHSNWVSGPSPRRTLTRPTYRHLEAGDVILNEVESSWMGYRAQGVQPIAVAEANPIYAELMKLQRELFNELWPHLTPGTTVRELGELTTSVVARIRPSSGQLADARASLTMHGRGQGDDGPIITGSARDPEQLARQLKTDMVFIFKPGVAHANGEYPLNWGDTIVIREGGPERLGKRAHDLWVTKG